MSSHEALTPSEHKHAWKCEGCDARITDLDKLQANMRVLEALSSNNGTKVSSESEAISKKMIEKILNQEEQSK
jgi:hypothetical protein